MQELQHSIFPPRAMAEVDLASRSVRRKAISPDLYRRLLGGRGINARIVYGLSRQTTHFLGSDTVLVLGAGLLTGTPAPRAARVHLVGISSRSGPLAGTMLPSHFGAEMRFSGYDHLVIRGTSDSPVYVLIHNGEVEFRDASPFQGADASETLLGIREELDDEDVRMICIGGEGESLSGDAEAATGLKGGGRFPAAAALMEAQNLKAVAARGTLPLEIYDAEKALSSLKIVMDLLCDRKTDGNDFLRDDSYERASVMFHRECLAAAADSLGIDSALLGSDNDMPQPYLELISAVTGFDFSQKEILEVGERIVTLEKLSGLAEAPVRAMPADTRTVAFPCTPAPAATRSYLEAYNRVRGWSSDGHPLQETLMRLGLNPESMDPL